MALHIILKYTILFILGISHIFAASVVKLLHEKRKFAITKERILVKNLINVNFAEQLSANGRIYSLINGLHTIMTRDTNVTNVAKVLREEDCWITILKLLILENDRINAVHVQQLLFILNTLKSTCAFTLEKNLIYAR